MSQRERSLLTVEHWQRIESVFHEALGTDREGREELLHKLCDGDAGLEAEVGELLEAFQAQRKLAHAAAGPASHLVGKRFGPYEVTRLIGQGGMGAVYLARRADGEFDQQVAIKLMGFRLAGGFLQQRFRTERQILASLNHPNITRLLDGGVTPDGEPYLVMEYVEGKDLKTYCRENGLSLEARLRLFRPICDAVQNAHQNLVVHRDLKPGNILVTPDGVPKLLDFGTAKLLAGEPEAAREATLGMMTFHYASPEQIRGGPVSTLSDIYSLGVVLYELLVGDRPFPGDRAAVPSPEREAERPSAAAARAGDRRLSRRLRGDLDNILLKALANEPQRRYASAEQLSGEIGCYLAGRPVAARKPSPGYRAMRFVRRNRWSSALVAVLAVTLLASAILSAREARMARAEAHRADHVSRFLADVLASAHPWSNVPMKGITVAELLDNASARLGRDIEMEPEEEAKVREALSWSYSALGDRAKVKQQTEAALARLRAAGLENGATSAKFYSYLCTWENTDNNFAAAEPLCRRSVAIFDKLGDSADPNLRLEALTRLGDVLFARGGAREEMERYCRAALQLARRVYGESDGRTGTGLTRLGRLEFTYGDLDGGDRDLSRAVEILRRAPNAGPVNLGWPLLLRGMVWRIRGDASQAEPLIRESMEIARRSGWDSPGALLAPRVEMARVWALAGRYAEAENELRECLAEYRREMSSNGGEVAYVLTALGQTLNMAGEPERAEEPLREALAARRRALTPGDRRTAETAGELGASLLAQGRREEARPLLEDSYAELLRVYGPQHPYTGRAKRRIESLRARSERDNERLTAIGER